MTHLEPGPQNASNPIAIRTASSPDAAAIAAVHRAAFGAPGEPQLVELITASPGFVPELSLIAAADQAANAILGHILLSAAIVDGDDGRARDILALAPMAVLPAHQGRGIGSALVRHALAEADRLRWPVVVVLGHPTFYPRFGFEPASRFGVRPPFEVRDEAFMAAPLAAFDPMVRGVVRYPPAFDVVT